MKRQYFIHPGRLLKIDQPEFQQRLVSALGEISAAADVKFIRASKPRGIQFQTVNFADMVRLSRRSDGLAPLGLQWGQKVYFLNERDRFGFPAQRIVEAVTIHEVLHVFGFGHTSDPTSIMNEGLTVNRMSPADIAALQRRFGKPK